MFTVFLFAQYSPPYAPGCAWASLGRVHQCRVQHLRCDQSIERASANIRVLERIGSSIARTRALVAIILAGGFALLFLVITVRLAAEGAWAEAALAGAFVIALGWQVKRWYARLRRGSF